MDKCRTATPIHHGSSRGAPAARGLHPGPDADPISLPLDASLTRHPAHSRPAKPLPLRLAQRQPARHAGELLGHLGQGALLAGRDAELLEELAEAALGLATAL